MFCSVCGKETLVGSQFCGGCGAEITPPLQTTDFPKPSLPKQVALWNPYAIWLWSLLFGTAFGSFLHAKNWQSLGQNDKAKNQYAWFVAGCVASFFAIVGVYFFVDDQARGYRIGTGVQFITLMVWYFLSARHQGDFIKKTYSGNYQRRPWLGAISIAATSIILLAFVSELLHPAETEKPSRPMVSSEVTTASINNVAVESDGQEYETQSAADAVAAAAEQASIAANSKSEPASAAAGFDDETNISALAAAAGEGDQQVQKKEVTDTQSDECKKILGAGLYNGMLEESCNFNGGVNQGLMNLFDAKGCRGVISEENINQMAGDVLNDAKRRYKAMGQAAFCEGNLDAYNELIDTLKASGSAQ